jgi:hypothetical protein
MEQSDAMTGMKKIDVAASEAARRGAAEPDAEFYAYYLTPTSARGSRRVAALRQGP